MPDEGVRPPDVSPTPEQRAEEFAARLEAVEARATEAEERASAAGAEEAHLRSELSRRDFLGFIIGIAGGAALGGLAGIGIGHWRATDQEVAVLVPAEGGAADMLVFYPRVRIASLGELRNGEPVGFEYPLVGQTAELVKLGKPAKYGLGPDGDVVAFSTTCTHMGWPLGGTFKPEECVFGPCPGHFSTFDATVGGQVTLGQATQKLPQVALAIEDDAVYAEGMLGLIYGYRQNLLDGMPVEVTS